MGKLFSEMGATMSVVLDAVSRIFQSVASTYEVKLDSAKAELEGAQAGARMASNYEKAMGDIAVKLPKATKGFDA